MTNAQIVVRLQRLQDLLTNWATGGWNNDEEEQEYALTRAELFELPGMKDAVPDSVRRCRTRKDFWGYIKTEHELPTYQSRRKFISDTFRPLLDHLEDVQPAEDGQKFFPKGSEHDAYTHIRGLLQRAKTSLMIIDGYMDATMYTVLSTIAGTVDV